MKCAAPGCSNLKTLQVGICIHHWRTLTLAQRETVDLAWIDYMLFESETNWERFDAARKAAFHPAGNLPPAKTGKRGLFHVHTPNWKKTARRQKREGTI